VAAPRWLPRHSGTKMRHPPARFSSRIRASRWSFGTRACSGGPVRPDRLTWLPREEMSRRRSQALSCISWRAGFATGEARRLLWQAGSLPCGGIRCPAGSVGLQHHEHSVHHQRSKPASRRAHPVPSPRCLHHHRLRALPPSSPLRSTSHRGWRSGAAAALQRRRPPLRSRGGA
jgi:hypothetical protein